MFEKTYEERTGKKWATVVPEEEWIIFEPTRSTFSSREISFLEAAELWRVMCNERIDALYAVCREFCVSDTEEEYEYGCTPLTSHGSEALKAVMKALNIKEGDPEYKVWTSEMLEGV